MPASVDGKNFPALKPTYILILMRYSPVRHPLIAKVATLADHGSHVLGMLQAFTLRRDQTQNITFCCLKPVVKPFPISKFILE